MSDLLSRAKKIRTGLIFGSIVFFFCENPKHLIWSCHCRGYTCDWPLRKVSFWPCEVEVADERLVRYTEWILLLSTLVPYNEDGSFSFVLFLYRILFDSAHIPTYGLFKCSRYSEFFFLVRLFLNLQQNK